MNTLHPTTLSKIAKNAYVVCVEIDMNDFDAINFSDLEFDEPSKFPTVDYDLSLVMPEGIRFDSLTECWSKKNNPELKNVSVVDIYDTGIAKSITVRFSFGADDRTLTGEEVQQRVDVILSNLNEKGIVLRA